MTRAVVLSGGGPVGRCWEAGLITALAGDGVVLREADAVIGTSAGASVGAQLLSGGDLADLILVTGRPGSTGDADMARLRDLLGGTASDDETRRRIGRLALDTWSIPEDEFIARFAFLRGREWPEGFACTAVDTGTGAFRVWDKEAGVELDLAVASSCAVPTLAAPITIGDRRYMDGGMRNSLNADLAMGHDVVLAVSCMLVEQPPGVDHPALRNLVATFQSQFAALREGGARVEAIGPGEEFLKVSGWGLHLMDFSRMEAAYQAGLRQGAVEANRLTDFWSA